MNRKAVLVTLLANAASAACEAKKPPPAPVVDTPAAVVSVLGVDASLGDLADPPAPAGDLKLEIERFTSVEACVAERAKLDPLVSDAIRAIGYDTFLRDACRMLEAAKDKKRETCDRLDSGALRTKCQTWVATIAQTPDACPMIAEGKPARGRVASCLAIAGRDPRLCASESHVTQRVTCEALVLRDDAKCDALLPTDRPSCKREVARWRTLLSAPFDALPKLPTPKSDLRIEGLETDAGPRATENAADVSRGVVVVTQRERSRVELGSIGESDLLRLTGSPNRRVRAGVALLVEPPSLGSPKPKVTLERFELDIPGEPPLSCPSSKCTIEIKRAEVGTTRGAEVSVALAGTIPSATKTYKVELDVTTYARDIASDSRTAMLRPGDAGAGR